MRRKGCKKAGGYFTVEASLIMPLVIFLIGLLFSLTFFLYNRCAVSQDTYILAFRAGACSGLDNRFQCRKNGEELKQAVVSQCAGRFGKKYMGMHTFVSTVEVDKKRVTVKAAGSMMPAFARQLLMQAGWYFQAEGQAERICPTECVRKTRLMKKTGEEWKRATGSE